MAPIEPVSLQETGKRDKYLSQVYRDSWWLHGKSEVSLWRRYPECKEKARGWGNYGYLLDGWRALHNNPNPYHG